MIKLERKAIYYLKGNYHHESKIESRTFFNMWEGLQEFERMTPRYFINRKDFTTIEEISLYYSSEFGIKCYYKKIDPTLETIETNYKKEIEIL